MSSTPPSRSADSGARSARAQELRDLEPIDAPRDAPGDAAVREDIIEPTPPPAEASRTRTPPPPPSQRLDFDTTPSTPSLGQGRPRTASGSSAVVSDSSGVRTSSSLFEFLDASHPLIRDLVVTVFREADRGLRYEGAIGRGGTATIGVSLDPALQRRCAIKFLHPRNYNQPFIVRGFIREAQITGQLDHPNIVPVHEIGFDDERHIYFTMKLVEGRSLHEALRGPSRRDHDWLVTILEALIKVCDALSFAHARGVLHCDLKSENIMLGEYGEVYLMDWGGARLFLPEGADPRRLVRDPLPELPSEETDGLVFGTPGYMAPEQALGNSDLDARIDVFAIGAILYEVLSGRPPYKAKTLLETLRLAQRCEIDPPDNSARRYPRELVRITMKALSRDRGQRYPSIDALRTDLQRVIRGGGNFPAITFQAGSHVIREGEVGDAAYIVEVGRLEVYRRIDGERVSLRILGPGDVFGETAIFAESPRTASVVAVTDTTLIVVTSDVIETELDAMKPWMGAFIRTLASRFREAEDRQMAASVPKGPRAYQATPFSPPVGPPRTPTSVEIDVEEEPEIEVDVELDDTAPRGKVEEIEVDLGSSLSNAEAVDDDGFGLSRPWWKR
ncbi:MAG: cyclic nucleotide-binding domain-containing protein [Myxococcales bacterium]|nr:cyclic nucleotide-binding domain-containing protein [Myxococcales bacterium]